MARSTAIGHLAAALAVVVSTTACMRGSDTETRSIQAASPETENSPAGEFLTSVPMLPASLEGSAARNAGTFAIRNGCPYLITGSGEAYLLAFMLRPIEINDGTLIVRGQRLTRGTPITVVGSEVSSLRKELSWEAMAPPTCDSKKIWAVAALDPG